MRSVSPAFPPPLDFPRKIIIILAVPKGKPPGLKIIINWLETAPKEFWVFLNPKAVSTKPPPQQTKEQAASLHWKRSIKKFIKKNFFLIFSFGRKNIFPLFWKGKFPLNTKANLEASGGNKLEWKGLATVLFSSRSFENCNNSNSLEQRKLKKSNIYKFNNL